jgi:hypothetical protein
MLFVVIMGTLWSVIIATDNGVRNVPPIFARAARTMGSKRLHAWLNVIPPASLPFIVSGMKQGWAFAWRSLMAAEIRRRPTSSFREGELGLQQPSGINHTVGSHSQWPARPVAGSWDWRHVCLRRGSSGIHIRPGWLVIDFFAKPCTHAAECRDQHYPLDDSWMN